MLSWSCMSKTDALGRYRIYVLMGVAVLLVWLNLSSPAPVGNVATNQLVEPTLRLDGTPPTDPRLAQTDSKTANPEQSVQLDRPALEPATRDPFNVQPPPVAPILAATPPPPMPTTPPAPPTPPPHEVTFAGRMTRPDGGDTVYVSYAGTSMPIVAGQSLPNGYRIETISTRAIELSYPSLKTTVRIDLPDSPKYEIR